MAAVPISVRSEDGAFAPFALPVAEPGTRLTALFNRLGHPLNTNCGERGKCRGCTLIRVRNGHQEPFRGCQTVLSELAGVSELIVPATSLMRGLMSREAPFVLASDGTVSPESETTGATSVGLAIDLGTTSISLLLCDRVSRRILECISLQNPQIRYGDNVMSRIDACARDAGMVKVQQKAVVEECLNPMIARLCEAAGLNREAIGEVIVAGNPTMLHLLAGENPAPLGVYPFRPVFLEEIRRPASVLGLQLGCEVVFLPSLGAFVGSDILSGIVAAGLHGTPKTSLLIDLGTNGEIVLAQGGRFHCCATAVGPAFEGGRLKFGMRAARGAINRIELQPGTLEPKWHSIEVGKPIPPIGICGTAYLDFLAEGFSSGVLNPRGRFESSVKIKHPDRFAVTDEDGAVYRLPVSKEKELGISEVDLAELLQAKAAIAGGIVSLLDHLSLHVRDLEQVLVCGSFGAYLNVEHAIEIGLLPPVPRAIVSSLGNSSLAGAYLMMTRPELASAASSILDRAECHELNQFEGFEDAYIDNLGIGFSEGE